MIVESLELDFDICSLHNLVNFSVLLPTYELSVLIGKFYLESNLVMESLSSVRDEMRERAIKARDEL